MESVNQDSKGASGRYQYKKVETQQEGQDKPKWRVCLLFILENWIFTTWMTILTVYALFGDDIRLLAATINDDPIFDWLTLLCLVFFAIEIVISSLVKEGYWLGFFFWLDVVSTVSLLTDLSWVWEPLMGGESSGNSASQAASLARAGRASRAGTRAGRIIRIIRIIRLIRIVKLYKVAQEAREQMLNEEQGKMIRSNIIFRGNDLNQTHFKSPYTPEIVIQNSYQYNDLSQSMSFDSNISEKLDENEEEEDDIAIPEESVVGKHLSELTIRRVIMLVLGMMFGLPLFSTSLYYETNTSYQYGLEVIDTFIYDQEEFQLAWDHYIDEHEDLDIKLIYLEIENFKKWESDTDPDELRTVEKELVTVRKVVDHSDYEYASIAIFDLRFETRLQSGLNMARTVFVCIVLAVSSVLFSNDANHLVLEPIEQMIIKVKKIAENPLTAVQDEEKAEVAKQLAEQEDPDESTQTGSEKEAPLETAFLEQTIVKIGALLALGFGEAGAEIIATNMRRSGGDIDPMIPGKKTHCVFGFCDIRNFKDTIEVLQQDVIIFVNEIAAVVHKTINLFLGSANKNTGDAFLLVWKFPDEAVDQTTCKLLDHHMVEQIADMSVISFVKIYSLLNKSQTFIKYRHNIALRRKIPNYAVSMGFGLHVGWAIEGAVGSALKIDACYLSPNVTMASRLEDATKEYNIPIIFSENLYKINSPEAREFFRKLDRIYLKGAKSPMDIYTVDLDINQLEIEQTEEVVQNNKHARVMQRQSREKLRKQSSNRTFFAASLFNEDEDIVKMRSTISKRFLKQYNLSLRHYQQGNWVQALLGLRNAIHLKKQDDGPSSSLIKFIDSFQCKAPEDWPGFRLLKEDYY